MASNPTVPVWATFPVTPPFPNLPMGEIRSDGLVYMTANHLDYQQLLWASIQGIWGLLDIAINDLPNAGLAGGQIQALLDQIGTTLSFLSPHMNVGALQQQIDEAVLLAQRPAFPPVSPYIVVIQASEAIAAGDFTNAYDATGSLRVRRADATDPTKFANGFAPSAIANGAQGEVDFGGLNRSVTVAGNASAVWLSDTTPGAYTTTVPSTSGHIVQVLGPALSGIGIPFTLQPWITL